MHANGNNLYCRLSRILAALGALLFALAQRRRPDVTDRLGPAIASGAIAGESLMGVAIAILISTGVLGGR